jgi:hypothetical protein
MEFINIISSFLQMVRTELNSNVERNLFGTPYKFAKIHPINNFDQKHDIETGLYHGEDMYRITIYYSNEECKWGDQETILPL